MEKIESERQAATKYTAETAQEQIRKLVFGETSNGQTYDNSKVFKIPSNTRQTDCTDDAITVAATLVCVCAKENAAALATPCFRGQLNTQAWNSGVSAPSPTLWNELIWHCPEARASAITATGLKALATRLRAMVKIISGNGYLGTLHSGTNCDGTQATAISTQYSAYTAAVPSRQGKIPWLDGLERIAADLADQETAITNTNTMAEQISRLRDDAYTIAEACKLVSIQQAPTAGSPMLQTSDKQECATQKNSKTTCENAGKCKWKGNNETKGE
uniref:Variant surface glycoprotein 1125.2968 n=1 Tax=Trypanosoma brucei TaxID=5691 RepID=A0A1J0R956_9TRYP|nr:variant surface glycoprotein 1125.2968 [Trypanosoma brucei]